MNLNDHDGSVMIAVDDTLVTSGTQKRQTYERSLRTLERIITDPAASDGRRKLRVLLRFLIFFWRVCTEYGRMRRIGDVTRWSPDLR